MKPQTPLKSSKGRPPVLPRIEQLEQLVAALTERLEKLEGQGKPMPAQASYAPRFDRWGN